MSHQFIKETILPHLQKQISEGRHWAVLDSMQLPEDLHAFTFFASSLEAEKYCTDKNLVKSPADVFKDLPWYGYLPVANLMLEYRNRIGEAPTSSVSISTLAALVESSGLEIDGTQDGWRELALLSLGMVVSATGILKMIPEQWIDGYHLVCHRHDFHPTIYEIGHSVVVLKTEKDWPAALALLKERAAALKADEKNRYTELALVGGFRGRELNLDYEGSPGFSTGITLATSAYMGKELVVDIRCDPGKEWAQEQRPFVRYNEESGDLLLLDDKLRPIGDKHTLHHYLTGHFGPALDMDDAALKRLIQRPPLTAPGHKAKVSGGRRPGVV